MQSISNIFFQMCIRGFCLSGIVSAYAQVLTLDSVLIRIEKNHPELKAYNARIQAYDAYATGAKALDAPQVGAGFFMTPYNTQMWSPNDANRGMGSVMLSAQQMITNPRKKQANATYMQGMSVVEKEMKGATKNEIFAVAKISYFEWLVLKKKQKIIEGSEELIKYIIKSTEIRFTYGTDKLSAYYKAKAMLGDVQQIKVSFEAEIAQKMIELNTFMLRDINITFDIDTLYLINSYENNKSDTGEIISKRSDYRALQKNINLLQAKQNLEKSKSLPDFGIKYDHMLTFGNQPQLFSLMGMISIPIAPWSSKMYKSTIAGIACEMEALRYQQQALLVNSSGEIQSLVNQLKNKKQQMELYQQTIIPSIKKNYQSTLIGYEHNTEELFIVLDAWQNLKTAELGALDLLKDLLQLQVQYEKQLEIR